MDYRIIKATAETGQIEVTYTNEGVDVATYAIDVPIIDGSFLTGETLDAEVRHRAPTWLLEREHAVKAATGFDQIVALVAPTHRKPQDADADANAKMWNDTLAEQQIARVLVKFGVLQSDPTTIEITHL